MGKRFQEVVCSLALALALCSAPSALGQYPASYSTTGPEAAMIDKKKREAKAGPSAYNLKLGPVKFRLGIGVRQEYNDNVTLTKGVDQRDDYISTAHVDVNALWPFSKLNTLDFTVGFAYSKYWNNPTLDTQSIIIQPNSALDFNVYVGDVRFNLFDKFALQEDPTTQPQLSGTSKFRRMENTIGLHIDWDLNKIVLGGGYEYYTFKALSGGSDQPSFSSLDHDTSTILASVGYKVNPDLIAGVQGDYSKTKYSGTQQNNSTGKSVELFMKGVLTPHISASAAVGYQFTTYDTGGSIGDNSNFDSYIYNVAVEHEMNRYYTHNLEISRYTIPGIGTNYSSLDEFAYGFTWDLIHQVNFTGKLYYQIMKDSGDSSVSESADRYGASLFFSYPLFRSWDVSLGYDFTMKASSISTNDYLQNRVFLDLTYHF